MTNHSRTVLLSPIVVLVFGNVTARISGRLLGVWSWIPVMLVYWITLALIMAFAGGWSAFWRWLRPSQGAWGWRLLSFATAVLFIPVFRLNFRSLNEPWVVSSWLAIAMTDPWLEEGYWRGLLMDSAGGWPGWLRIAYTTFWFGLSHPLLLGVNVKALAGFSGFIGTVFHRCHLVHCVLEDPKPALADFQPLCGRSTECKRDCFPESCSFGQVRWSARRNAERPRGRC